MTGDGGPWGPLGRRLLAAFVLVALSSVAVLTLAALVGTERGLAAAREDERDAAAASAAAEAARAYAAAGGWTGADLTAARAVASGADARLVIRDSADRMMMPGHAPAAGGPGRGTDGTTTTADVIVGDELVGRVTLVFGAGGASTGRTVAWGWVFGAGAVALVVALVASAVVTHRLTRPLTALTRTARRFAAGERSARSGVRAPGELGELARAFDTMADDVVRAESTRRHVAADVAHEIRTPLAGLQAGLEELRDGLVEPAPERLGALHDQALRLGRVVDDLAQLSAAESAALSLHPVPLDLARVVASAAAGQEAELRAAGLRVVRETAGTIPVRGDPDRLHQAIVNLLANAARYCRSGDEVSIWAGVAGERAVVRIRDTGPGIAAGDLPHIFDRLWRGPASESVAGSGIGLAVVRELVVAHGGTVTAESTPGGGATFTIQLPLAR